VRILQNPEIRREMVESAREVSRRLGGPGASDRAAEEILAFLA
jgi:hypothetical protein